MDAARTLDFLRTLWRLDHALNRISKQLTTSLGITAEQRLLIRCVGRRPGISAGELATELHLDPGTISATVARLQRRRLVTRRRDPHDRRRVIVALTPAGAALDRPMRGTIEDAIARSGAAAPRDLAAARRLLEALCDRLEQVRARP